MPDNYTQFEKRKQDHIELALMQANQACELNGLDAVHLMHEALPDLDFDELNISSTRLGMAVEKPLMVASMTAGHAKAEHVNRHLMEACAETGWAMGVGSQRRELTDPHARLAWKPLRDACPRVELYGNLGIAQLITTPVDAILRLTEALGAHALMIHCNPLQECIQPEGTPQFKGCWDALAALVKNLGLPVVVKETGCGFSTSTLVRLQNIGVAAVDVSGLGGTHWGRIEGHRAQHAPMRQQAAQTFRNWGIDTAQSIRFGQDGAPDLELWGSGGVRHGLDAAKLFALGAHTVAFAKPMLEAAMQSTEEVIHVMQTIEYELRVALFCTGSLNLSELREKIRC
ncbi:MAG: type 2 isopentenyl-diphosphate Delta-isomerase [Legionellaceae bacterium]|jgi:isopentenyl-diphosphate delta-isomerase|nr:type 2 isopentenyl-diphosphate Delta-isomerase [Legionellaceae bacterium]